MHSKKVQLSSYVLFLAYYCLEKKGYQSILRITNLVDLHKNLNRNWQLFDEISLFLSSYKNIIY